MKSSHRSLLVLLASAWLAPVHAHTEEGRDAFARSLSREFAAMRAPATDIATPQDPSHAACIELGNHYSATLLPANRTLTLQLSGRDAAVVGLLVSPA